MTQRPAPGSSPEGPPGNPPGDRPPGSPADVSSSAAPPASEAAPHRIVVVGDDALADRLGRQGSAAPAPSVTAVPSFLSAMGELSTRSGDPVAAVVGPVAAMAGMVRATAMSLRKLAPSARLVVLGDDRQRDLAEQALAAGFDRWCDPAGPWDQLAAALGLAPPRQPEQRGSEAESDGPAERDAHNRGRRPADVGDAMAAAVLDDHCRRALRSRAGDGPDQAEPTRQPHRAPDAPDTRAGADPGGPPRSADRIGDVDLAEAVMAGGGRLAAMAMELVRATSGIAGVDWCDTPEAAPAGHGVAWVELGGFSFGALHAPAPASEDRLAPWAAWLARWLALDRQSEQLRDLAMRDELTGVYNRRYFNRFLGRVLDRAQEYRRQVTLLVFDIDDFKGYNDRFGHAAGDEVLAETARLMQSVVRDHDVVARIGGDEFAVIFWDPQGPRHEGSEHPQDVVSATRRFQQAVCAHRFPKLLDQAMGTLTISGGLAGFPWDGLTADQLLDAADRMAIASKRQGKNVVSFGPGAKRRCGIDDPP